MEAAASGIETELRTRGTSERAEAEKKYLKTDLEHIGATMGDIRATVKSFVRQHPNLSHDDLITLTDELWAKPVHERRMAAVVILESCPDLVGPQDFGFIEKLIRESKTWALVDGLATQVAGNILANYPNEAPTLDRWATDDDFWVRRSALLAHLKPLKGGGEFTRFARYAEAMLDGKEFFIRKTIGWVLREMGRSRPAEVFEWLAPRTQRTSGVTIREAIKYLDPARRDILLTAYNERWPA